MTPKEKAEELLDELIPHVYNDWKGGREFDGKRHAIQCALICCNNILGYMGADRGIEFWQAVKKEIEKL